MWLSPKLFREVCGDVAQFVTRFLVGIHEALDLFNFLCNNKNMRAETTTIAKGFAALVTLYLFILGLHRVAAIKLKLSCS